MKKIFTLGFISFVLALSTASGVMALRSENKAKPAEAANFVNNVWYVFSNDSTCSSTKYYQQSGKDETSLGWNTMTTTDTGGFTIPGPTQGGYTLAESSANKNYNYCYRPFFFYPFEQDQIGIKPLTRYTISVTFTLSMTKSATGGGAYAFAELFLLGNSNSTTNQPVPSLVNNVFDTNQSRGLDVSIAYNNATDSNSSIGIYNDRKNDTQTTNITRTITFDNASANYGVSRYQLGLFVGCNYGSSYNHTTSATVTAQINSVTKTNIVATTPTANYTTFQDAYNGVSTGGTITLVRNTSLGVSDNFTISKSITLNLNGKTLSAYDASSCLSVASSQTLNINGGGGAVVKQYNVSSDQPLIGLSAGATLNLNNVAVDKMYGPSAAIQMSNGSLLTANNTTSITIDSDYTTAYAIYAMGTCTLDGATVHSTKASAVYLYGNCNFSATGGSISSTTSYAIECHTDTTKSRSISLSGSLTLSSSSLKGHICIPANCGVVYANGLTNNVTIDIIAYPTNNTCIVQNDNNSKVSIRTAPAAGHSYVREGNNIYYRLNQYTVRFYANNGSSKTYVQTKDYGSSYSLPNALGVGFDAPTYYSFQKWNTNSSGTGSSYNAGSSVTITEALFLYAIWYQTDTNKYDEFRIEYLHMNYYTEEKGWCMNTDEHHYYQDAKDYFYNSMTKSQRVFFANNYTDEMARLQAWARANEEEIIYQSGDWIVNQFAMPNTSITEENDNPSLIIMIAVGASSLLCLGLIILKKKHSN